jgi:twitching motility protein PilT
VANLIRESKISQIRTVLETSSKEGMISLDQSLKRLFDEKLIEKDTAQNYMENPELLDKFRFK